MAALADIKEGMHVSFDTYTTSRTGNINNAKVLAVCTASAVLNAGVDPTSAHVQVKSMLPATAPDNPSEYGWLILKVDGERTVCIGKPWIKEATLMIHENQKGVYTIEGLAGPEDHQRVLNILRQNGYSSVTGVLS